MMPGFSYVRAKSLEEAVRQLAVPGARLHAGGTDLLGCLQDGIVTAEKVVSISGLSELRGIKSTAAGGLRIGALATLAEIAANPAVQKGYAALSQAAAAAASPQLRNQGTIGGNLCQRPRCWYYRSEHAKCLKKGGDECFSYSGMNKYNAILGGGPSYIVHPSDLAPALVALGASVTLASAAGERTVALEAFYTLPSDGDVKRETVLRPDEVLTKVHVPAPEAGMQSTYLKFRERGSYDFALSAVALCVWRDGAKVRKARVALGGVAPVPWRSLPAERALAGAAWEPATFEKAGAAAVTGAEPLGQNGYKVPLTRGLVVRALQSLG